MCARHATGDIRDGSKCFEMVGGCYCRFSRRSSGISFKRELLYRLYRNSVKTLFQISTDILLHDYCLSLSDLKERHSKK